MEHTQASGPPGEYPGQPTIQEQLDAEFYANWLADPDDQPLDVEPDGEHDSHLEHRHHPVNPEHDQQLAPDDSHHAHMDGYHYPSPPPGTPHEHSYAVDAHPDPPIPALDPPSDPYEGYQHLAQMPPGHDPRPPPRKPPLYPPNPDDRPRPATIDRDGDTAGHSRVRSPVPRTRGRDESYSVREGDVEPVRREGGRLRTSRDWRNEDEWYGLPRKRDDRRDGRGYRSPPRDNSRSSSPQVQVYAANQPPPAAPAPAAPAVNLGETMQMMMMSQMMQQQMQAQQMQAVQMAAMMGQKSDGGGQCSKDSACGQKKGSTLVNIGGGGKKRRVIRRKVESKPVEVVVKKTKPVPVAPARPILLPPPMISGEEESGGFENWQEATIILCLMIVGLIYLVSSRATAPPPKDDKKAARHLNGPS